MDVLKVENLKKYYGETKAVDGVSFNVESGEIFGFLGPNGAGKTTTIRCMMDFLRPDSGKITIFGKDARLGAVEIRKDVGFLSGEVHLYKNWTGRDHIEFVRKIKGVKDGVNELVELFKFDQNKKAGKLSSGNKQKLGLILALMHNPKLLILDEPTTGLDPLLQRIVYRILRERIKNGATIFFSSHNLAEVERIADRVCILKDGMVVDIELVKDVKKKRMYTITALFEGKFAKKDFEVIKKNGVEIIEELPDGLVFNVKGDIDPILRVINKYDVKDLEILHGGLEDVLFEFYE